MNEGKLILIGIPLGNIEDITLRAIRALFSTNIILAEDTRNFIKLRNLLAERFPEIIKSLDLPLEHKPELISYREENHNQIYPKILKLLEEGKEIGLISDAGMPAISDPGFRLVEEVLKKNFEVDTIPGPTAVETALVLSGLPTDKFTFIGFLPREKGKIVKIIEARSALEETFIYYESPFRVLKSLEIIAENFPEIKVAACNDLTKKFQKIFRGDAVSVVEKLRAEKKIVGEWAVVISKRNDMS